MALHCSGLTVVQFTALALPAFSVVWLGSVVVGALDLQSVGRRFDLGLLIAEWRPWASHSHVLSASEVTTP